MVRFICLELLTTGVFTFERLLPPFKIENVVWFRYDIRRIRASG
jgi:hypothetical protein